MAEHKIITLTGTDRIGKQTQSTLLTHALTPSARMDSPDYTHWSGHLIRAILMEKPFQIATDERQGAWEQGKHPQIFQMLQTINTASRQERIRAGLKTHHWIMDRYDIDAYAYGVADGCALDFLFDLQRQLIPSDLAIVLVGTPFPRPGETPDLNERDSDFQARVRAIYEGLAATQPDRFVVLDVDQWRCLRSPAHSIADVHYAICFEITKRLGLGPEPRTAKEVQQWLDGARPEAPRQLELLAA